MTNTCFMCGATIEINKKQKYVCEECDRKIKLLKQLTNVDKAKEKIEKKAKRKRIKDLKFLNLIKNYFDEHKCFPPAELVYKGVKIRYLIIDIL